MWLCDANQLFLFIFLNCIVSSCAEDGARNLYQHVDHVKQIQSCLSPELEENEREMCRFFAAIIDAGSTGTRLHLFEFSHDVNYPHAPFKLESETFKELKPGLSSCAKSPALAAENVVKLVKEARRVVPKNLWLHTPITLKATAGLRLLPGAEAEAIMSYVKDVIESSGFLSDDDSFGILCGMEEGIFGWFTLNYLLGRLGSDFGNGTKTAAAMDLGGGSTQVTFVPKDLNEALGDLSRDDYFYSLNLFDHDVNLYTHSYLGNGLIAARLAVAQHTSGGGSNQLTTYCFPYGFELNDWDYAGNLWALRSIGTDAGFESCMQSTRHYVEMVTEVRQIYGLADYDIYAFSYFHDRGVQAGLSPADPVQVKDFREAARKACSQPAAEIGAEHWMPWQCFDLTYIYVVLRFGYGLPDEKNVQLIKRIENNEVSWALGAAYHLLNDYHRATKEDGGERRGSVLMKHHHHHNTSFQQHQHNLICLVGRLLDYISDTATHLLVFLKLAS